MRAPELNPVETVRACRRAISVFETCEEIVAGCCDAWNVLASDLATVRSIATGEYAKAVNS